MKLCGYIVWKFGRFLTGQGDIKRVFNGLRNIVIIKTCWYESRFYSLSSV